MAARVSVIVGAVRTPFGKLGGGLAGHSATELGAIAIRGALERAGIDPREPGYVIMGQVLQGGVGQAPARQAAIGAGLPLETPSDTINKVCASSIRAVEIADSMIRAGDVELVVTGGMESMSNAPYVLDRARFGYRLGDGSLIDLVTARRARLDASTGGTWSSRRRSSRASSACRARSRTPGRSARTSARSPRSTPGCWRTRSSRSASSPRTRARGATRRSRSSPSLKPVFDPEGTTTAGNAPGVNDGASCVVVASEEWARRRGIEPLATILSQGYVAGEVAYLARTPAQAAAVALERAGKSIDDVARVEINEAFSSVAKHSTVLLGADEERVNVNGGAVALGHPIGASGGRILGTMVHDLRRTAAGSGSRRSAPAAARATRC